MLRLKSLGQTIIEANEARVTPSAETVFATTLYLIVEAGRPVGRDELTRMIWPGVSEARAQHGLRQVLYKLKTFGATIKADRSSLTLSPRFCSTDFADLLEPQPNSVLEALAEKVSGSFLPGYRPELSEQFATWVERQRDIVHSAVARALVAGMQAKKRVSDWTGAEQFASMCLSIDPLNEEATLTVAEAAALGGSKSKALSILNNYLRDIGEDASEIKLPAALLRRRISEAYQDNVFPVRDAPFVGREEEMAELTRALARAQAGHGSAYVITGEPGIGKTRLVQEFTRVAALQRVHIVRVGCQSHDVRRPLSVFVDMVPKLLALPGALGCSPESMGYLRRLVAHDAVEARDREQLEHPSVSEDAAGRALLDVLDAVSSEACILLQLEDAQWLDELSGRLVEQTCNWARSKRLLLLLTSRTPNRRYEASANILMHPLSYEARHLVADTLANRAAANREEFVAWCVSSSGGNPYYLIELIREGVHDKGEYRPSASLTRLLSNRVTVLDSDSLALLEACCVLAQRSTMERIEACLEMSRTMLIRALDKLDGMGMIELDSARVLCKHDLLSTVVLSQMSHSAKSMLHRFAATQLESEFEKTQQVALMWESAEHWLSATDTPRAIQLLRQYGIYLMDVGMPTEAENVLKRALTLAQTPLERYRIGTERARAIMRSERNDELLQVLEELTGMRNSLDPQPSELDEVGTMYLHARWQNGDSIPELVKDCLGRLSSSSTSPKEAVAAADSLLIAADNLCDYQLGQRIYASVIDRLQSTAVAVESRLSFQMIYHCAFGDALRSRELAKELAHYAREQCPPTLFLRHLRLITQVYRCHGSAESTMEIGEEAYRRAQQLSALQTMSFICNTIASIFLHVCEFEAADLWLGRGMSLRDVGYHTVLDNNTWSYGAELAIRLGDVDSAEQLFPKFLPAVARSQSPRSVIRKLALQAHIAFLRDRTLDSATLNLFLKAFESVKFATGQDFNVEALCLALRAAGRIDDAVQTARCYLTSYRRDLFAVSPSLITVARSLGTAL